MRYPRGAELSELIGKTMSSVVNDDGYELQFVADTGEKYTLRHHQSCCEHVTIEDINGDLNDLIGSPILLAEESTSTERPEGVPAPEYSAESEMWTFYKFATIKGYVDVRWYGESNGYYSESVDFDRDN